MFFNKIKDFWIKKSVKKTLSNIKHINSSSSVVKVGILIDDNYSKERKELLNELKKNAIQVQNIQFLAFKNTIKKTDVFDYDVFSVIDLGWNGTFSSSKVIDFCNTKFDLLINYYDQEKAPLLLVSIVSKADFKVGFSAVDDRINQLVIDAQPSNSKVFSAELIKYLKILNKL